MTENAGPAAKSVTLFSMSKFDETKDLPIIYNDNYNVSILGMSCLFPGDSAKWRKTSELLNGYFAVTPYACKDGEELKIKYASPNRPVSFEELRIAHSGSYLDDVHSSRSTLASITESWIIMMLPMCYLNSHLLDPVKWQVAGSLMAAYIALKAGWSINLGGGFHQASSKQGETFCIFADITFIIMHLWRNNDQKHKFLIIDLDAHQGTGIERDIAKLPASRRSNVFVFDVCNSTAHPDDPVADSGCDCKVPLARFTADSTYLKQLKRNLRKVVKKFQPTLIIYNAGSDCLKNDPLGLMNLSDDALMIRDELVFKAAKKIKSPIVMLLSGGYLMRSSTVVAKSIRNLYIKGIIQGPRDGSGEERKKLLLRCNIKYGQSEKEPPSSSIDFSLESSKTLASTLPSSSKRLPTNK